MAQIPGGATTDQPTLLSSTTSTNIPATTARTYAFRTLDVFTSTPYAGNQLGIVTVPASNPLTQTEKQSIATEFNYSESIFVHTPPSSSLQQKEDPSTTPEVKVDIFTTDSELPFAGHPTIGAINHILTHIYPERDSVIVRLKAGPVLGRLSRASGVASAEIPQETHLHDHKISWDRVVAGQEALGNAGDAVRNSRHALVSIVRGMNFALIDLSAEPELLRGVKVTNVDAARGEDLDRDWPATLVGNVFFVRKPDQGDGLVRIDQRVMVIGLEDPATGSASCALTCHLALEMGGEGVTHSFELIQGEQMGRRSVILTQVTLDQSGSKVEKVVMSGECRAVMRGELDI